MALWQTLRVARLLNGEATRPIRALQVLEPVHRDARRPCSELEKVGFLLWRPASDDLPEPLDDLVVGVVTAIVGEPRPVVTTIS